MDDGVWRRKISITRAGESIGTLFEEIDIVSLYNHRFGIQSAGFRWIHSHLFAPFFFKRSSSPWKDRALERYIIEIKWFWKAQIRGRTIKKKEHGPHLPDKAIKASKTIKWSKLVQKETISKRKIKYINNITNGIEIYN